MNDSRAGTIFLEDAEVLDNVEHPGEQWIMRLRAPRIAAAAEPGSFMHLRCDTGLPMRRPMSVMRADRDQGWVEILFKVVGTGTRLLAGRGPGERLSALGPIGHGFEPSPERPRALLLGGGVGIPPMIFLADHLRADPRYRPLVLMGSEVAFPFDVRSSRIPVPGIAATTDACLTLLDEWGVPSRLASLQGYPGCHSGFVPDLARAWIDSLDADARAEVAIFACGPTPMLRACAELAASCELPCQLSLEEHMACAVGGCAGCVVPVRTADGVAMRRVCVDGPVFDGATVIWG